MLSPTNAPRGTDANGLGLAEAVARHIGHGATPGAVDECSVDLRLEVVEDEAPSGLAALVRRANHDELTGLANRSWFVTAVDSTRAEPDSARPAALFIIDLDGFKAVNDTWGHNEGDVVLREVGARLQAISTHSGIAARLGGDEFALWVPDCTTAQASLLADRIVTNLSEPVPGDLLLTVGASVGWVTCTDNSPASSLLSRADTALYAVKERGGHGHQPFTQQLASARLQGRILQREIRHAMRVGQFCLARQQIMSVDGGSVGTEILARWRHPRRGLLMPKEFMPAIAAAGSSATFDAHIVDCVFAEIARRPDLMKPHRPVWINLSSESLTTSFASRLLQRVDRIGLPPGDFVLEVSEHASVESDQAVEAIEAFAGAGLGVAIDDFGSGYSRLGVMKRLPIDYVKIDRLFTTGLATDDQARSVAESIISLVQALGAEPVAEGVEDVEDVRVLTDLGCHLIQGYVFSKPSLLD